MQHFFLSSYKYTFTPHSPTWKDRRRCIHVCVYYNTYISLTGSFLSLQLACLKVVAFSLVNNLCLKIKVTRCYFIMKMRKWEWSYVGELDLLTFSWLSYKVMWQLKTNIMFCSITNISIYYRSIYIYIYSWY